MLDGTQRTTAAGLLWAAERDLAPADPLTEAFPGIDVADAREIQLTGIRRRITAGARLRGHKVGLSSLVMPQVTGADEPGYGHLLDTMVLAGDAQIQAAGCRCPRIAAGIGYVLAYTLPSVSCNEADVLAATDYIVPSLELTGSRIRDGRIDLADTVADNASSAGIILGEARRTPAELTARGIDLTDIEVVLYSGDEEIVRGNTGAAPGNPTARVAWLARKMADYGVKLEAGHLILPGSCTQAIDARPGTAFRAEFAGLGTVTASFE
jgi:2-keto-4-pentenoate hydratase